MAHTSQSKLPPTPSITEHMLGTTDFTFTVQGTDFPVHRRILAEALPYFDELFKQTHSPETQTNRMEIYGISEEAFGHYLKYIYVREVPAAPYVTDAILKIAHKFDDQTFKAKCEASLIPSLDRYAFSRLLVAANKFDLPNLKKACLDYFMEHRPAVIASPTWNPRSNTRPAIFLDLCLEALQQQEYRFGEVSAENEELKHRLSANEVVESAPSKRTRIH